MTLDATQVAAYVALAGQYEATAAPLADALGPEARLALGVAQLATSAIATALAAGQTNITSDQLAAIFANYASIRAAGVALEQAADAAAGSKVGAGPAVG